ncbi:hypothetical protein PpBr36_06817, partial [Pyricularia pennisetigena]|uniref:hypothetical protein n=1 Tax=Pyricularia pennisetigena TaxID=1578925 RepID=UPI0011510029
LNETPREDHPSQRFLWRNETDGSYVLYPAPYPLPEVSPLPAASGDSHVRQIHDAGDISAVFRFGDSLILKVKLRSTAEKGSDSTAILTEPYEHQPWLFYPSSSLVLFHTQEGNMTFLLELRIQGQTLNEVWWNMSATEKDRVATRIAAIVNELRAFQFLFGSRRL